MSRCNPSLRQAETDPDKEGQQAKDQDVSISTSASTQILCDNSEQQPVLSRRRWFILFAMCVFGLCLKIANETSAILDQVLKLLDLNVDSYVYINQIFNYLLALLAIPSAMFLDRFGIRATVHAAACFFVVDAIFKALLYFTQLPGWSQNKMYYYIASHLVTTQIFTLFFLLPLKVSESWFSESERSTAWTIMFLQLEIGACIASYVFPRQIRDLKDFDLLAYLTIASATIALITCVACVTKSEPDVPPSKRAASKDVAPLMLSIKRIFKHKGIMLHQTHAAIHSASFASLMTIIQNIFSSMGHSQTFTGNFMLINEAILTVLTFFMAGFVHKVSNTTLACKFGSLFQSVQFVILLTATLYSFPGWSLIAISIVLTCCRGWTIPHFNNMTAQLASGVVSQPTIVGFSILITPLIVTVIQVTFAYLIEIDDKKNDYYKSLIFLIAVIIANELVYQIFFHAKTSPGDSMSGNDQANESESQRANHYLPEGQEIAQDSSQTGH